MYHSSIHWRRGANNKEVQTPKGAYTIGFNKKLGRKRKLKYEEEKRHTRTLKKKRKTKKHERLKGSSLEKNEPGHGKRGRGRRDRRAKYAVTRRYKNRKLRARYIGGI